MRTFPKNKDDRKDLAELNVEPWMVNTLKLNPSYVFWGPHEDYMIVKGDGWHSAKIFENWKEFGPWHLDELNECVNFYFELNRDSKNCESCAGTGYHPDAHWVSESFYHHSTPFKFPTAREQDVKKFMSDAFGSPSRDSIHGRGAFPSEETLSKYKPEFRAFCEAMRDGDGSWHNKIVQEEVDVLVKEGRLREFSDGKWRESRRTADQVNAENTGAHGFQGHDGINRGILIEARLKRFGIPERCPDCKGHGYVYTAPAGRLSLILWWLHPRKGAARGIEIKKIEKKELPKVYQFLRTAAKRNAKRFEKVISVR